MCWSCSPAPLRYLHNHGLRFLPPTGWIITGSRDNCSTGRTASDLILKTPRPLAHSWLLRGRRSYFMHFCFYVDENHNVKLVLWRCWRRKIKQNNGNCELLLLVYTIWTVKQKSLLMDLWPQKPHSSNFILYPRGSFNKKMTLHKILRSKVLRTQQLWEEKSCVGSHI